MIGIDELSAVGNRAEWTRMSMEQKLNYVHTVVGDESSDGRFASEEYAKYLEIPESPVVEVQEKKRLAQIRTHGIFCDILIFHRKKTHPHWITIRERLVLLYKEMPDALDVCFIAAGTTLERVITLGTEVCELSYLEYRTLALAIRRSGRWEDIKGVLNRERAA